MPDTSPKGLTFLKRHEGVVLRAYRDAAGVWTIGCGLTAASGVVRPKAGMVITEAEADRLLGLALARNYEPAVARAMPGARPHEFDAGVSFHFNTGAIDRASWVNAWRNRDWAAVLVGLRKWTRGGGRVLPGLRNRREAEFRLLQNADYGVTPRAPAPGFARWALPMTAVEKAKVIAELYRLGYKAAPAAADITADEVRRFQRDHGLTSDGVIGRATLSALQRRIDAARKTGVTAGAGAGGAVATQAPGFGDALPAWAEPVLLAGLAAVALWLAWTYRDVIAAKLGARAPKLAGWLRSF
jgi:lysozyme